MQNFVNYSIKTIFIVTKLSIRANKSYFTKKNTTNDKKSTFNNNKKSKFYI